MSDDWDFTKYGRPGADPAQRRLNGWANVALTSVAIFFAAFAFMAFRMGSGHDPTANANTAASRPAATAVDRPGRSHQTYSDPSRSNPYSGQSYSDPDPAPAPQPTTRSS